MSAPGAGWGTDRRCRPLRAVAELDPEGREPVPHPVSKGELFRGAEFDEEPDQQLVGQRPSGRPLPLEQAQATAELSGVRALPVLRGKSSSRACGSRTTVRSGC